MGDARTIVEVMDEFRRWKNRVEALERAMKVAKMRGDLEEAAYLKGEMGRAREQMEYYRVLLREMKTRVAEPGLKDLFSDL